MHEHPAAIPSYGEMFRVFGRIGLLSFGGPAGQIALMHRELVEERAWLDEPRFLHALNFCMLLPGPEAMQLATYSGWLMRGVGGGLLAGLLFILPGFAVIMALSAVYFHYGDLPVVAGVLFGLKAAVLAIIVEALLKVSRRALKTRLAFVLAGLGLAETTPGPLILVLVFVGFLGGAREAGLAPMTGGMLGGSIALFFTFAPCFLWIFAGAPHIERLRSVKWLSAGLSAITAAVVGVIANLAVWFALHVLFASVGEITLGPLSLPAPDLATFNVAAFAIALGAGVALLRFHLNLFAVLFAATLAGIAVTVAIA